METLQVAVHETARIVTSKSAKRAVVNSVILLAGASTLLFLASIGSALFFQNFVPDQVLSRPVYLQYGSGTNPYGFVPLKSLALKTAQHYDISVTLSMPPSQPNVERGNFMVTLYLLDQEVQPYAVSNAAQLFESENIIFSSRRPTLVPYMDPVVSLASRVLFLFYYMLFPSSRTCEVIVPLAERLYISKGAILPASAFIEIEAGQTIQTYQVLLTLTAHLQGLRWLMHHYRLPMYLLFTFLFWVFELLFMAAAWSILFPSASAASQKGAIKPPRIGGETRLLTRSEDEAEEDLSDHPKRSPAYGKQQAPKDEPAIKDEEHGRPLSEIPIAGTEANDEGDDDDGDDGEGQVDAGFGTSYHEGEIGQIRRRASSSHGD